jgi:beta-galactosidase
VAVERTCSLEPETLTVSAWVQIDRQAIKVRDTYIVSKGSLDCVASSYALYIDRGFKLAFYILGTSGTIVVSPYAEGVADGWHFVVGSWDGAASRLYLDGLEVGSGTVTQGDQIDYALEQNDFFIGTYSGSCTYFASGVIDEVAVYDRPLSAAEVRALYTDTE